MKTLATIALSFIAVAASLCFVLSSVCAYNGGISGTPSEHRAYFFWAIFYLAIVVAAMTTISKLNRRPRRK